MMDGITVISEEVVKNMPETILISGIFSVVAFILTATLEYLNERSFLLAFLGGLGCAGLLFMTGCAFGTFCYKYKDGTKMYKVTIDESVSMNKFNERYEVVSQDGDIFTIVERDMEKNDKKE